MSASPSLSRDGWRLALGTLSVFRTAAPIVVDRQVGGRAMAYAPAVGVLLAVTVAGPLALLAELDRPVFLLAIGAVAALAALTRAIHLDGLADVADGLGSGRSNEAARAIMKKSDIGPFGVATLVLVLLAQVGAATQLSAHGWAGAVVIGSALAGSRAVLGWLCGSRFGPASEQGLGSVVIGAVSPRDRLVSLAATALVAAGALTAVATQDVRLALTAAAALVAGQAVAYLLARRCDRRFAGLTGDVLGACVETAFTTALVVTALLAAP